jgi:hypothetical protein
MFTDRGFPQGIRLTPSQSILPAESGRPSCLLQAGNSFPSILIFTALQALFILIYKPLQLPSHQNSSFAPPFLEEI